MRLDGLRHRYPGSGFELGPLDLEGPDHRPWLILGGAGAGKSTLLRLLGGNLRPFKGTIRGGPPGAYLPQLPERALAGRNLAEDLSGLLRPGRQVRAGLRASLREAGLEGMPLSRRSRDLSHGERRRLALAILIRSGAEGWALDEPEAGLDRAGTERLLDVLRARLAGAGGPIWIATHAFERFGSLDPWALVLREGRPVAWGNLRDILGLEEVRESLAVEERAPFRLWRALASRFPELPGEPFPAPPPGMGRLAQIHALLMDRSGL